jgi:hypothetical protein
VRADGIALSLAGATDGPATLRLEVEKIAHDSRRPLLVPLSLVLSATRDGDEITFEARLEEGSGNMVIDLAGRHGVARGQGTGTLTLYPILFLEDGFQPGRLSPYFAPRLGPSKGSVALAGPLAWSDEGLSGELVLTIEDFSTVFDEVGIVGVNAAITFDRLLPPSTPPGQLVALAGIDLGLPLTDGLVELRLDRDGRPLVERSEWRWAGGKVRASFSRREVEGEAELLVLEIEGIGLGKLLELTPQGANIDATGTLYGRIPVVFRGGEFVIVEGWLESDFEGGEIHYTAAELEPGLLAGGEGVNLLLEVLDNFHYSRLRVDLDGLAGGETEVRFRIRGSNPDFYGGAEIEFNPSITGNLEQILRQSYEAYYEVPEEVARRLARAAGRGEDGE